MQDPVRRDFAPVLTRLELAEVKIDVRVFHLVGGLRVVGSYET